MNDRLSNDPRPHFIIFFRTEETKDNLMPRWSVFFPHIKRIELVTPDMTIYFFRAYRRSEIKIRFIA